MLKKLLVGLLVALGLFVVIGFSLPRVYTIERSVVVGRTAGEVYRLLNGFAHFQRWSPWADKDPAARYELSGPEEGVGARLEWRGDPRLVGTGSLEIIAGVPYQRIDMALTFDPATSADTYFVIDPKGENAGLTWGMVMDVASDRGLLGGLLGRYFGLFLDHWVGADFERGLTNFVAYAATLPARNKADPDVAIVQVEPVPILYVSGSSSQESSDVTAALAAAFAELSAYIEEQGVQVDGQPMAITRAWDESGFQFDAAVPVADQTPGSDGRIRSGMSPGGRAVRITHRGSYTTILDSYRKLAAFVEARGLAEGALSWEHYVTDPATTPPEDLLTYVYLQLAD